MMKTQLTFLMMKTHLTFKDSASSVLTAYCLLPTAYCLL